MSVSSTIDDANQLLAIMIAEKLFSFLTRGKVIAKYADPSSMKGSYTEPSYHHAISNRRRSKISKNCNDKLVTMRRCAMHNFEANCFQLMHKNGSF